MFLALMLQNVSVLFMVDLCQCVWCVCVCVCVCVCMRVTRQRIHFETLGKGTKNAFSIDTVICTVAD